MNDLDPRWSSGLVKPGFFEDPRIWVAPYQMMGLP